MPRKINKRKKQQAARRKADKAATISMTPAQACALAQGVGPAERYWEGRWRDEAADNERLRIEVKTLRKQAETLKEGWRISDEGRIEAESENERLRETANAQFHRANKLRAENERLRGPLMSIERIGIAHSDSFARQIKEAQDIARAALGREGDA